MKTRFLPVALATVALTLSACGGSGAPSQPKGPISEDRTAAFKTMMPEFTRMGKMVKDEEPYDVEKFKQAAATFAENSKKPFTLFESDPQATAAPCLPSGQTQQHQSRRRKIRRAVEKLNAAAQTGKLEEIKAAYGETGATCKSCHDTFRGPE